MCGFVGILHLDARPVERPMLAQMARAIAHRGPDGEGSFVDGPVGFHHKRLAIIDLHSGQQPMTRDGVTVVFNPADQPVTVALNNLNGTTSVDWTVVMAGAVLSALPTALVYIFLGRFFIRGLLAGSMKG